MFAHFWRQWAPLLAVLGSVTAVTLGTSLAKHLFPVVGAQGTAALRVGIAAVILLLVWRPWRWPLQRAQLTAIVHFGLALGAMNLLFYMALRTIPFGLAVAIEFSGPLAVAIYHSRRPVDGVWLLLAIVGLGLILPWGDRAATAALPLEGLACAAGAAVCWALYIVLGRRLRGVRSGQATAWGLLCAALLIVPLGAAQAGVKLLDPSIWGWAVMVAVVASIVPYSLEMWALRRLPPATFGIALATEPVMAALMGLLLLQEQLHLSQWAGIACIMTAAMGSAVQPTAAASASAETSAHGST